MNCPSRLVRVSAGFGSGSDTQEGKAGERKRMQHQQQQQPPAPQSQAHQMMPMMPSSYQPPPNITTDQIQKYLDDNKKLILAILDNQNLGKLAECAQYQALLQKNLMYLAAIADAQPQAPAMPAQMTTPTHPVMQAAGGFYMQQQQAAAAAMAQQAAAGLFPQKVPGPNLQLQQQLFNNSSSSPHQLQDHHHLQQQPQQLLHQHQQAAIQGQIGAGAGAIIRPGGGGGGVGVGANNGGVHPSHSEASLGGGVPPVAAAVGPSKQDTSGTGAGHIGGGDDGEPPYKKGGDEAK